MKTKQNSRQVLYPKRVVFPASLSLKSRPCWAAAVFGAENQTGLSIFFSFFVFLMTVISGSAVLAHGLFSEDNGTGQVRFYYDDDTPLAKGYVVVFDIDGNEIGKGATDSEGLFDYSRFENVGKISVDDVHGHHCDHEITETALKIRVSTKHSPTLAGSVLLLLAIAAIFYALKKFKPKSGI